MSSDIESTRPDGIAGVRLPGPYAVGEYAAGFKAFLSSRPRVQVFGEVFNLRIGRGAKIYFELRDPNGAVPCSMWRNDFDAHGLADGALVDGAQIVAAGGPDYYPGHRNASPSFSFLVTSLRIAGEGDLLAQIAALRKRLDAQGLLEPQKRLPRPALPRAIGIVTGEGGKARDDILAGLRRRGWAGRIVWAFAPVQDRNAAPKIVERLTDLAAVGDVDVIVVARGGGSLSDLMAFSDEALCRTVALLPIPVIASVGHHTDVTLIDSVAAVSCSTPTHAAEAAVRVDVTQARAAMLAGSRALARHSRRAMLERAHALREMRRAPAQQLARHRARLHQQLRELRASARRGIGEGRQRARTAAVVLDRQAGRGGAQRERATAQLVDRARRLDRTATDATARRRQDLQRLTLALATYDPDRKLERGYALVTAADGDLITDAQAARDARSVVIGFHDGQVPATIDDQDAP
jgi:exodeoxyribonuclease VII large subunit